jgi:hypothetical protein
MDEILQTRSQIAPLLEPCFVKIDDSWVPSSGLSVPTYWDLDIQSGLGESNGTCKTICKFAKGGSESGIWKRLACGSA